MGKSWEIHGKMGKSWENHGNIMGKYRKSSMKIMKHDEK